MRFVNVKLFRTGIALMPCLPSNTTISAVACNRNALSDYACNFLQVLHYQKTTRFLFSTTRNEQRAELLGQLIQIIWAFAGKNRKSFSIFNGELAGEE